MDVPTIILDTIVRKGEIAVGCKVVSGMCNACHLGIDLITQNQVLIL